jgi:hypothetical protein
MTETVWRGAAALIRPGTLAFTGSIGITGRHSHHAVQIMAADTQLTVLDGAGHRHNGTHTIIPADTAHQIAAGAAAGIVVFLDPDTASGRAAGVRKLSSDGTRCSCVLITEIMVNSLRRTPRPPGRAVLGSAPA